MSAWDDFIKWTFQNTNNIPPKILNLCCVEHDQAAVQLTELKVENEKWRHLLVRDGQGWSGELQDVLDENIQLRSTLSEIRDVLDAIVGNSPLWEIAPDDKRKAIAVLSKYPAQPKDGEK
jgi:hypothetical protein